MSWRGLRVRERSGTRMKSVGATACEYVESTLEPEVGDQSLRRFKESVSSPI